MNLEDWATRMFEQRMRQVATDPLGQYQMQTMLTDMVALTEQGYRDVAQRMLHTWWDLVDQAADR